MIVTYIGTHKGNNDGESLSHRSKVLSSCLPINNPVIDMVSGCKAGKGRKIAWMSMLISICKNERSYYQRSCETLARASHEDIIRKLCHQASEIPQVETSKKDTYVAQIKYHGRNNAQHGVVISRNMSGRDRL